MRPINRQKLSRWETISEINGKAQSQPYEWYTYAHKQADDCD